MQLAVDCPGILISPVRSLFSSDTNRILIGQTLSIRLTFCKWITPVMDQSCWNDLFLKCYEKAEVDALTVWVQIEHMAFKMLHPTVKLVKCTETIKYTSLTLDFLSHGISKLWHAISRRAAYSIGTFSLGIPYKKDLILDGGKVVGFTQYNNCFFTFSLGCCLSAVMGLQQTTNRPCQRLSLAGFPHGLEFLHH